MEEAEVKGIFTGWLKGLTKENCEPPTNELQKKKKLLLSKTGKNQEKAWGSLKK